MAGIYFSARRNTELSTLKYLEDSLNADWTGVTVVKSFNQAYDTGVNPPIVACYLNNTNNITLEVGSTTLDPREQIAIDIFARSDGQRIDLAAYIVDKLRRGWTYYAYSHASGDNTTLDLTSSGRVQVTSFDNDNAVGFGGTVDVKDRFRHTILCTVRRA